MQRCSWLSASGLLTGLLKTIRHFLMPIRKISHKDIRKIVVIFRQDSFVQMRRKRFACIESFKWSAVSHSRERDIVLINSVRESLGPVILRVSNITNNGSNSTHHNTIMNFDYTMGARMIHSGEELSDSQCFQKRACHIGRKLGSLVAEDVFPEAVFKEMLN